MAKLNAMFLAAAQNSMFNNSAWEPVGEPASLEEIWNETNPGAFQEVDGDVAEVTATEFSDGNVGLRISVPFKNGSCVQLKLSGKSKLEEGDKVKVSSIKGQLLKKFGADPIVKYDGELAE